MNRATQPIEFGADLYFISIQLFFFRHCFEFCKFVCSRGEPFAGVCVSFMGARMARFTYAKFIVG